MRKWIGRAMASLALLAAMTTGAPPAALGQEPQPATAEQATLTERLAQEFAAAGDGEVNFLVILKAQANLEAIAATAGTTQMRAAALYPQLTALAAASQADLRAFLEAEGAPFRPFYIVNMIEVTGDAALAEALRARPEVARLTANPPAAGSLGVRASLRGRAWSGVGRVATATVAARPVPASPQALPWGLTYVGAPAAWAAGVTGAGIVVGSQDTGVEWNHPALQAQYRGWNAETATADHVYNWFDSFGVDSIRKTYCAGAAALDAQVPCDDWGHGSHTVGTMVGDATSMGDAILGMAPDAQWIGCRNMTSGVGTPASYAACFQFFLAPFPQDGDPFVDGRPELAPHIINNSWGCPPSEGCDDPNILRQVVETARAAGQFVAASAGNSGNPCFTVQDPIAIYDAVFTVGAFGSSGGLAGFSSRGPVTVDGSGRLKPDLAAPGVGVRSATRGGGISVSSGTSMASPHVAGAVALLWSAQPALVGDIDSTEALLRMSATVVPTDICGVPQAFVSPNPLFGAGRLDVAAALDLLRASPALTVTVVNTAGQLLPNVAVRVTDPVRSVTLTQTTNLSGTAYFPFVFTRQWPSGKTLRYIVEANQAAQIWINLPETRYAPIMPRDFAPALP